LKCSFLISLFGEISPLEKKKAGARNKLKAQDVCRPASSPRV
jgi:hypothetical protein